MVEALAHRYWIGNEAFTIRYKGDELPKNFDEFMAHKDLLAGVWAADGTRVKTNDFLRMLERAEVRSQMRPVPRVDVGEVEGGTTILASRPRRRAEEEPAVAVLPYYVGDVAFQVRFRGDVLPAGSDELVAVKDKIVGATGPNGEQLTATQLIAAIRREETRQREHSREV